MKKMKKSHFLFLIFIFFNLLLSGCGKIDSNRQTAKDVLLEMNKNGEISDQHLAYLEENASPELLNRPVEIRKLDNSSVVMKFGESETLIDVQKENSNSQITSLSVNGKEVITTAGERNRERNRNVLEGILGLLSPNERNDIEDNIGLNLGDLIDLGYSNDRDEAQLILLGTLVIKALRNFRDENPDKPFVALYAFGNSTEAILQHKSASHEVDDTKNKRVSFSKVVSSAGLIYSFFDPLVGTIIRVLGALVS